MQKIVAHSGINKVRRNYCFWVQIVSEKLLYSWSNLKRSKILCKYFLLKVNIARKNTFTTMLWLVIKKKIKSTKWSLLLNYEIRHKAEPSILHLKALHWATEKLCLMTLFLCSSNKRIWIFPPPPFFLLITIQNIVVKF